ncbi:hypothetical protein [Pandoraea norimbergensis]|uniref:Glycerophosphoryl diester phosphodiesterase membrane domain-containing protein n=1 Tax=Pandoraea norimbergensis TaxID=93219 RepID=A0ABN4JKB4_9BURK|nr:hypothetical protein [Pandoraea norimbergensis]ALS61395.1 hypothetical protein AT302_18065 [Pandoraea norimbergensis]
MEPITFKQCFKGAWRDGFNALRSRPLLSITIAVVMLVATALNASVKQLTLMMAQSGGSPGLRLGLAILALVLTLVIMFSFAVLSVHVYRHTILGADAARQTPWYGRDLWRYVWMAIQIGLALCVVITLALLVAVFALRAAGMSDSRAAISTFTALLLCALVFFIVRMSLIFAQVSVGRAKRWRAAWDDTRGHFWVMLGTGIVTVLPLLVGGLLLTVGFGLLLQVMPGVTTVLLGALILQTLVTVVYLAVGTSLHGWFYLRYADRLLALDDAPDDA